MVLKIRCLTVKGRQLGGLSQEETLEMLEGEEVLLCDYDGILRGKYNFKLYTQVARFFEVVVFNLVRREIDFIDTMVAGASRVVVDPQMGTALLRRILDISPGTVFPYGSSDQVSEFSSAGGQTYISGSRVNVPFEICYNVGLPQESEKYVDIVGFPDDLLAYI